MSPGRSAGPRGGALVPGVEYKSLGWSTLAFIAVRRLALKVVYVVGQLNNAQMLVPISCKFEGISVSTSDGLLSCPLVDQTNFVVTFF